MSDELLFRPYPGGPVGKALGATSLSAPPMIDGTPCCEGCGYPIDFSAFVERTVVRGNLTPKEANVLRLLCKGLSTKEMAAITGNTDKTLKHHIASVFYKLNVKSRAGLFAHIFPTYVADSPPETP